MKNILVLFSILGLIGCAGGSGSDGIGAATSNPVDNLSPDNGGVPVAPGATPTPAPMVGTPTPTPTPPAFVPGPLYCYVNNGVYCTNGALSQSTVQLSMSNIFTGGNPTIQVVSTSVQNNVLASSNAVCLNANQAGCYAHSSCVTATLAAGGNLYQVKSCGNLVNGNGTFSRQ